VFPACDLTIGEMIKQQEKMVNDLYNSNNNPVETPATPAKAKKE
jgi:hypothetical protein